MDDARKLLRECRKAIANANCQPEAFGIGGNGNTTHWYLRDELLDSIDAFLAQPAASAAPGAGVSELTRDRIEELRDEILFAIDRMPSAMMSEMSALCDLALQSLRSDAKAPGAMPEEPIFSPQEWLDKPLDCAYVIVQHVHKLRSHADALQAKLIASEKYVAVLDELCVERFDEIAALQSKLSAAYAELKKCNDDWNERYGRMLETEGVLQEELVGLRAFKRGVDEALNSGDGTYKP